MGLADRPADDAGKLEAMQIRLDDGSILPDVAFSHRPQHGRHRNQQRRAHIVGGSMAVGS
jgi:hypothetical protein